MFETLDEIRTDCANRLIRAARDRKSPMHTPVIVTADVDARVMVLRAFDPASWTLRLHTEQPRPKNSRGRRRSAGGSGALRQGRKDPASPARHGADRGGGALCRRSVGGEHQFRPALLSGRGAGRGFAGRDLGPAERIRGCRAGRFATAPGARENFAVMLIEIAEVDWLYLAHTGPRPRAVFPGGRGLVGALGRTLNGAVSKRLGTKDRGD